MSNWLITQVYGRQVGNLGQSAVMALMADAASDDGTGIWPSKQTMAEALGMTRRGVMKVIDTLVVAGLLTEVGQRECRNGFTVEYAISLDRLMRCPILAGWRKRLEALGTSEPRSPLPVNEVHPSGERSATDPCTTFTPPANEVHPTCERGSPKPSLTLTEPNVDVPAPKKAKRKVSVKVPMADDWKPAVLPDDLAKLVALWPADRLQRELREFREYWIERGERRPGWDRTWRQWVGRQHERVLRESQGAWRRGHTPAAPGDNGTDAFLRRMERTAAQNRTASSHS